ncbi:MAG: ABC transporter substrate-binding protein [Archangiaceae bacterium]|nr:ABC transporter substrate-binding protein [Archangiaceae bacterium]
MLPYRSQLLVAVSVLVAACSGTPDNTRALNIGALIDRTGNNSEPSWVQALKLAEQHLNAAIAKDEKFKAYSFHMVLSDSINEPRIALRHASELVRDKQVKAIIVDSSQDDVALNQTFYDVDTANDLGVPLQCAECTSSAVNNPASTDPAMSNRDKWNFRATTSSQKVAMVIARELLALGPNLNGDVNFDRRFKLGVYVSNETFGQTFLSDLRTAAVAMASTRPQPVPVSVEETFHPRDAEPNSYEWRGDLDRLTDAAPDGIPDAIVVATFAEYHAAFVRSFKGSYPIKAVHAHNFRIQSTVAALGTLGDGEEGISPVLLDASGDDFADQFRAATSGEPLFLDSVYYDSAVTLGLATLRAGVNSDDVAAVSGAEVRDAMFHLSEPGSEKVNAGSSGVARAVELLRLGQPFDYEGASSPMDYDSRGNVMTRLARYQAQGGSFVELDTYDCVADPKCPKR